MEQTTARVQYTGDRASWDPDVDAPESSQAYWLLKGLRLFASTYGSGLTDAEIRRREDGDRARMRLAVHLAAIPESAELWARARVERSRVI